jgi:hypothetical protein
MGPLIRSGAAAKAKEETRTAARKLAKGKNNEDINPRDRIKRKLLDQKYLGT